MSQPDKYKAEDAAKTGSTKPAEKPTHIHLPDNADPSALVEAAQSALGDEVKG